MNTISQHIAYLLLSCRKVEVPGLGTFNAFYERASFDADDEVFYPSRLRILFNTEQNSGVNLLESSLERQLNLKGDDAGNLISEYVDKIKSKIERNHYCRLEGIGYLMSDKLGNLSFKDTFWKRYNHSALSSICF